MALNTYKQYISLSIHLLAWAMVGVLLIFSPFFWNITLPNEWWIKQWILYALLVGAFYLNTEVLAPHFLFRDKIYQFIGATVLIVVVVYWTIQGIENWLNIPELWHKATRPNRPFDAHRKRPFDMFTFLYSLLVVGISTSVTAVQKWQKDAEIRRLLEQEKIKSELSFLKAQINPHFFFNTLNNIYALTLLDVDLAREALHKLSRMMRYVLYETQQGTVRLSQEIAFLQDYVELMKLRLTDKVKIRIDVPSSLNDVMIAPMLLLPFLENSFKHGVSATQPSHIYLKLVQEGSLLTIEIRNTLFSGKRNNLDESNGIGLINTRRRLDLLYPDKYKLTVSENMKEGEFVVTLQLDVSGEPISKTNKVPVEYASL
ncbi:MAG: histidine kinase [Spirosomataceae bacterium]